ncbi:MAG: outer membrane lipoprotein-sorting protein [Candidatus Rokubacteria bacterium RBG_16_73_20]|nr:MAG: outer membrane lipoprotein-sorting protein [Candidatus Rokubacteria bacterium GWA2_73_35]OGK91972.1 MAG: outer membrane lipoprotein-sorting protein [Candidatus Rokubacteria bacterium RBG_16_73_20]
MMTTIALLAIALLLAASPAAALDGADILRKVDANLQPESFESYRKLIDVQPSGARREFLLWTLKKGKDKIAALFLEPASEKGRATLRLGDNMWLYIPGVGKPIRITNLQSVTGSVFNNADIMRLDYHTEYDVRTIEEQAGAYFLDLRAKTTAVAYDRLKMWVDRKTLLPTRIECYAATGLLIKTLYFKEPKPFDDGRLRPAILETDSPLYKGYRSYMVYARIKKRVVPDEVFTLDFLPRIETMR